MENFTKEIKSLIIRLGIRDIQLEMIKAKEKGLIISEEVINEILAKVEADNK